MINREVTTRIDELILDDGYIAYDKLTNDLKEELTALAIRALGSDALEVLTECNDPDENICDLIHHLLNCNNDSAWRLADTLRDNAVDYCAKSLANHFEERMKDLEIDRMIAGGLKPIICHRTGETRWIK